PVVCESSATSMRALYMWNSSGEVRPARQRSRASRARRSRSSIAWRVTISSTSQPREATSRTRPSSATAYTALRWPASVALPSCGTSRSRMLDCREMDEAAREPAALRHEAEQALPVRDVAAAQQFVEHDVDRRRAGVAGPGEVGEPAVLRDRQADALQRRGDLRAEELGRHVRQEPVDVA